MMSIFDSAVSALLAREGGFSNDASDAGGATRWGITEFVARKNGYTGAMDQLPIELAKAIYKSEYWDTTNLDEVALLSFPVAQKLFDIGVNIGTGRAGLWFQQALNVFNRQGRDYPDVQEDEQIGPATISAFRALLAVRHSSGEVMMLRALACLQGVHYIQRGQKRPANEDFEAGWFLKRVWF